jgi:hypothetical protein
MKNKVSLLWGIFLVVIGGVLLANNLDLIADLPPMVAAGMFGVASLLCFIVYFASGVRHWGWLFPAIIFAGLTLTIILGEAGVEGNLVGALWLACISLPFWVILALDRKANWWAAIPGWVMIVLSVVVLLADRVAGETLGALVMLAIALPFFAVYLVNPRHWWALIPGFILGGIGAALLLVNRGNDELLAAVIMFAVALPFFLIYFRFKEHWWALIPAGVMTSIGIVVLLAGRAESDTWLVRMMGGVLFLVMAFPFAILWAQRAQHPTTWAKYPAIGLALAALLTFIWGAQMERIWPVVLIAVGFWLVYEQTKQPKLKG